MLHHNESHYTWREALIRLMGHKDLLSTCSIMYEMFYVQCTCAAVCALCVGGERGGEVGGVGRCHLSRRQM